MEVWMIEEMELYARKLRFARFEEHAILEKLRYENKVRGHGIPDAELVSIASEVMKIELPPEPAPRSKPAPAPRPAPAPSKVGPRKASTKKAPAASMPAKREIVVNGRQRDDIANDVVEAVKQWNDPPRLFRRAEGVVLAHEGEAGAPALRTQTAARFLDVTARVARYISVNGRRMSDAKLAQPEAGVALERLTTGPGLPLLLGFADAPRMRPDGSLLNQPGYDKTTGLYAHFEPLDLDDVPERPTAEQVIAARDLLLELVADFPFVGDANRANALAAVLTVPLRMLFDLAPLFAFDAPAPGTGKSLLCRVINVVGRGIEPSPTPLPSKEEEVQKTITALLREARPVIWWDNISTQVESDALCTALTSPKWNSRILGSTETTGDIEHATTWMLTGNNLRIIGDLVRRTVLIKLDARVPNPESRADFTHPLPAWAIENRARLLGAIFTLGRHWIAEGRPHSILANELVGSFEGWQHVIGGILELAGITGFLENRAEQRTALDDSVPEWAEFARVLATVFKTPFTVKQVVKELGLSSGPLRDALPEALGEPESRDFATKLGNAIRQRAGRIFALPDGATVEIKKEGEGKGGRVRWVARLTEPAAAPAPAAPPAQDDDPLFA